MSIVSTGGNQEISSRVFTIKMMEMALIRLPWEQAQVVRRLTRNIQKRTGLGYYSALNVVASLGGLLVEYPTSVLSISSKNSSKAS